MRETVTSHLEAILDTIADTNDPLARDALADLASEEGQDIDYIRGDTSDNTALCDVALAVYNRIRCLGCNDQVRLRLPCFQCQGRRHVDYLTRGTLKAHSLAVCILTSDEDLRHFSVGVVVSGTPVRLPVAQVRRETDKLILISEVISHKHLFKYDAAPGPVSALFVTDPDGMLMTASLLSNYIPFEAGSMSFTLTLSST